ncbi:MAG: tetratricopeptide repeat protein [Thermodesulfobacteriota bacterium]
MDSTRPSKAAETEAEDRFWAEMSRLDPASPALLILAERYLETSRADQALTLADRVWNAHPYFPAAALLKARALLALNRPDEARRVLSLAAPVFEDAAGQAVEMARLGAALGETALAARFEAAAEALKSGPEVESPDEDLGRPGPAEAVPTETLAALYLKQGHPDQAREIYRRLVALSPEDQRLRARLADLSGPTIETGVKAEAAEPSVAAAVAAVEDEKSRLETLAQAGQTTAPESIPTPLERPEALLGEPPPEAASMDKKKKLAVKLTRLRDAARRRREAAGEAAV